MSKIIETDSMTPLYKQLSDIIEEKINNGEYPTGYMLPSEAKLCDIFKVSRVTVRKAITYLVEREMVIRRHGKGTFVVKKKIPSDLFRFDGFTSQCKKLGIKLKTHVLVAQKESATIKDMELLNIGENDSIVYLLRIRYANDIPVVIEHVRLPYKKYGFLLDINLENKSLYQTIAEKTGANPEDYCSNNIILECGAATADEARYLRINKSAPLFIMKESVVSAVTGEHIHYTKQVLSGEYFRFYMTSTNNMMNFNFNKIY